MASIDHLREDTSVLKVKEHNEILTKQYLVACYLSTHSNHRTVTNNPTPRHIRQDLTTYIPNITHLIPTIANAPFVKEAQNLLHQSTVVTATNRLCLNRVINQHTPPVSDTEGLLPELSCHSIYQDGLTP